MSTDYIIHVKRKSDKKEIAKFLGNHIKSIKDSTYSHLLHSDNHYDSNIFSYNDLASISNLVQKDIDGKYKQLNNNNILLLNAKTHAAIEHLTDENKFIEDSLEELYIVYQSTCILMGEITCVTEDIFKKNKIAYEYNSIPDQDNNSKCIFVEDIFCEIEACY